MGQRRLVIKMTGEPSSVSMDRPELDSYDGGGYLVPVFGYPTYTFEGQFEIVEDVTEPDYVQVEFAGTASVGPTHYARGRLYTYIDPGFGLKIGDLVDVPTQYEDHNIAVVRELGPDNKRLAGYIVKEVSARYYKEEKPYDLDDEEFDWSGRCDCGCQDE